MWFAWRWMDKSKKEFPDVVLHGESAGAGFVVPFKINAFVFLPLPVGSDRVVFLKFDEKMLCVMITDILDAKIIDG